MTPDASEGGARRSRREAGRVCDGGWDFFGGNSFRVGQVAIPHLSPTSRHRLETLGVCVRGGLPSEPGLGDRGEESQAGPASAGSRGA